LHNNGYIKILNDEFDLKIGEKTYQFKKDKQITFADWDNLFILTDEILRTIIEIIGNKNIGSISEVFHKNESESDTEVLLNNSEIKK
jgi:hypothetical protein